MGLGHAHAGSPLTLPTLTADGFSPWLAFRLRRLRVPQRVALFIKSAAMLRLLWFYIFCVSIYDIWLVIAVGDVIFASEQNPICLALIKFDSTYYSLFIAAKVAGTLFAIACCDRLASVRREIGAGVTGGLAGFQSGLLVYLSC